MVEHDGQVGQLLKKLDDLGIANNTIVIYTTDNGAETFTWPDGGTRRSAARRTPTGKAAIGCRHWCAGLVCTTANGRSTTSSRRRIWVPTLMGAAGEPDIKNKLLQGYTAGDKSFQGAPRRLRPARPLAGKGSDNAAEFLLDRRRQPRWARYDPVQGRVHGAEGARFGGMDAALGPSARAQAVQPAFRPVRARGGKAGDYDKWFIDTCLSWFRGRRSSRSTFNRSRSSRAQKPGSFSVNEWMPHSAF